jgi:AraC-like DNA-binding protein
MNIILLIGSLQGLVLSCILFFAKKANHNANKILALLVLVFSFSIFIHSVSHGYTSLNIQNHSTVISSFFFLVGPLLFIYTKLLTKTSLSIKKKHLLHAIPFLVIILPYFTITIIFNNSEPLSNLLNFIPDLVAFHIAFYLYLTIRCLRDFSKKIKETFSSVEKKNLNWLKILITCFGFLWIGAIISDLSPFSHKNWDYESLLFSFFIYLIGYAGLLQPEIFSGSEELLEVSDNEIKKKYQKSTLTEEMISKYSEKLLSSMNDQKLFMKNDLTLPELSGTLSISVHHLSQIINEKFNQNFFEFINKFRIEEAKNILSNNENQNITIASIGFDTGFNSISSFNSAFKKYVGVSPSQFRKQALTK